ncbi:type II toxin-antitoxin system Phd/YefM family antitoxin [Amorphus sp. 3PC139-8]|uniref:type II toxin-antitoxin system Phd/YefM family antitoxin n=1 Tax=Amorphus sp. 3PC139-8 TaxID=2735676 RepID=UPI00345DAB68
MLAKTENDLRQNFADVLERLADGGEPILITRDNGKPAAILMSLEDFASYEETRHLLQSPRNADRLLKAVSDLDAGEASGPSAT